MSFNFGQANVDLRTAIRRIAAAGSAGVKFTRHAERAMDDDGFDHLAVLECLRKGMAYGPEIHNGELRANVVHRGLHIRVVVGGLDGMDEKWTQLQSVRVVSVMEVK